MIKVVVVDKADLRKKFKASFNAWAGDQASPSEALVSEQAELNKHLIRFLNYSQIGFYHSLWGEPNLNPVFESKSQVAWVLPRVVGDELEWRSIKSNSILVEGDFGILEPDVGTSTLINLNEIKIFLIPGVAFDLTGTRLGRGKGYYDKTLKNFKGTKVGVAFNCQLSDVPLPREAHDVRMDFLATPMGVRKVS